MKENSCRWRKPESWTSAKRSITTSSGKRRPALIAAACSAGAASVSSDEDLIEQMRTFGELIGIAFQIKDDLLDYGDADIGKPTGIDIKERK